MFHNVSAGKSSKSRRIVGDNPTNIWYCSDNSKNPKSICLEIDNKINYYVYVIYQNRLIIDHS